MTEERLEQIRILFEEALKLTPAERRAFLERSGSDGDVLAEVESLLAQSNTGGSSIEGLRIRFKLADTSLARLAPSTRLGPYEIIEWVGAGGMGEVYRARDTRLDRVVAIKILPEHLSNKPQLRQRFEHEARAVSSLNHPHICTLHDVGSQDGVDYVVMEYIEGETLAQLLKKGPLATEQVLEYALQITDALASAHRHGLIHRDVKPANIMVSPAGHVKVMDFGLAKRVAPGRADGPDEAQTASALTQPGVITGTLAYMSPEQLRNDPLDPRSDLFALGVTLYEMLTGRHPFQKRSTLETAGAILNETPTPALRLNPNLPSELERIIDKSLEKDRDLRYQSAAEMHSDLRRLKRHTESHTAVAVTLAKKDVAPARRLPWVVAAALILSAGAGGAYFFLNRTPEPPKHPIHIAVLPFRTAVGDASLNFVADVMSEVLTLRLSRLEALRLPTDSNMEQISKLGSPEEVGRRLGVDHIIQGSVTGSLERLYIRASVEHLGSRPNLLDQQFVGGDLALIEDQICIAAASSLGLERAASEAKCRVAHPSFAGESYDLYLEGRKQMRSEHVDQALILYRKAVQADQNFALAYTGMVDAWLAKYRQTQNQKWLLEASNAAVKAQSLNDDLPEAHFALGAVYTAKGQAMEAINEIKKGFAINPTDDGFRRLGEAYQVNGQLKEAINAFQSAVAMNPHYSNNFYHLGEALYQAGDLAHALVNFQKFKDLEPDNPIAFENVGAVYIDQGECEKAIPQLNQALKLKPDDVYAFENLGNGLFCLKQYPQSVAAFERARNLSPDDTTYVGNLADAYRRAGREADAILTYKKAIALAHSQLESNPRNADVMGNLALCYAKTGNKDDALTWINKARSLSPQDVDLEYDLAVVTALSGAADQACDTLLDAIKNGKPEKVALNDPELTQVLQSKNCRDRFEKSKGK